MKIISWNINGIRAAYKKGFESSVSAINPDILCLQEVRCSEEDLEHLQPVQGYQKVYNHAQKKGYSGVSIYSKQKPKSVEPIVLTQQFADEGRSLLADFGDFHLLALYIPNGGRNKENMEYKLNVYEKLITYLAKHKDKNIILAGDFNIAHEAIDLARPKENENGTMFTSQEREQISRLLSLDYIDTYRILHEDSVQYSWWANWANSRARNIGWRIDYIFLPEKLKQNLSQSFILDTIFGSDHCPVGIELT